MIRGFNARVVTKATIVAAVIFKISFGFNLEDRQSWFPGLLQRPLQVNGFSSTDVYEFWVRKFIINICIQYIRKNVGQNLSIFIRRMYLDAYIIFFVNQEDKQL